MILGQKVAQICHNNRNTEESSKEISTHCYIGEVWQTHEWECESWSTNVYNGKIIDNIQNQKYQEIEGQTYYWELLR